MRKLRVYEHIDAIEVSNGVYAKLLAIGYGDGSDDIGYFTIEKRAEAEAVCAELNRARGHSTGETMPRENPVDAAETETSESDYIKQANLEWASNDVQIDDTPGVSIAHGGAWVQAWVWVPDPKSSED